MRPTAPAASAAARSRTAWEGQDDVTEEVDVITREFVIKKHRRRKYRCKCGCLESADMPARLVPGGRYSNEFAVEVATMKYVDQLPLERIVKVMAREGLVIDSQTLWDQVNALATRLSPAHERLREKILGEKVIGMDQSPWKVLGHAKSWQMWTLTTTTLCYFDICKSKGEEDDRRVLGSFAGTIIGDAATTHAALSSSTVSFAHCWAHVIRRAKDLSTSDPLRSAQLVKMIQQLYELDAEAGDDDQRRREIRDTKSRKVFDDIYAWRLEQRPLSSSPTAQVLGYLDNQKAGLKRFLDDPRIPLDNNQSERGYCWVAVGRRSFFGSRSKRGTEVAALFYSLAESARRVGVEPRAYFSAALAAALAGQTVPLPNELAQMA
jgi:transposase